MMDLHYGAMFDGMTISLILYGATCGQVLHYFWTFRNDPVPLRLLVGVMWLMDTFHSILIAQTAWHYLIAKGDSTYLERANWTIIIQVIPTELLAATVDCFFIQRIWRLGDRKRKALILLFPTIFALCVSIAYVVKCFHFPLFVDGMKSSWLLGLFSTSRALVDIVIAAGMCTLLYRRRTGFARSNSLIRTVIHYTLATGLLTSLLTTAYIITFFVMPTTMVYIGVYFVHGKVYLNSMLVALNSRKALRERASKEIGLTEYSASI